MLLVEARFGRPLENILRELYLEQGKMQREVADVLGVDNSTVSQWMVRLGIEARPKGAGSIAEAARFKANSPDKYKARYLKSNARRRASA